MDAVNSILAPRQEAAAGRLARARSVEAGTAEKLPNAPRAAAGWGAIAALALAMLSAGTLPAAAQPIRPDPRLTPGAFDPTATAAEICAPGYSRAHRHSISRQERAAIFATYGIDPRGGHFELDHRVPVELGGLSVPANLWPELYDVAWGAHVKDRLEDRIHVLVCGGWMSLREGQDVFLSDWIAGYRRAFGGAE